MPTAFMAEYSNSMNGRRVGFCSEYDALPGYESMDEWINSL